MEARRPSGPVRVWISPSSPQSIWAWGPSQAREARIALAAADRAAVPAFGDAVAHGAEVLQAPKQRPEGHAGYDAFVRGPDGNSVEALGHR